MRLDRRTAIAGTILAATMLRLPAAAKGVGQDRHAAKIRDLIGKMTLPEKLGQMTQIPGGRQKSLNSKLDDAMLARVRKGEVGSFLHVAGAEPLKALQKVAVEESRLGIPLLFAMDVIHGYRTILPVPLALAASWDEATVEAAARLAAEEAWAAGLHWTFAPMVDIARDARWGRVVEGAGEDPYLGSRLAAAQVRGFQGPDLASGKRVMACAKHFAGYGAAEGGRDYDSAELSARTLNEVYLPPFHAAAEAGAGSFMTAFNDVNGVPMTANAELVRGHLRGRWGYNGLVVSDWNSILELVNHGVAENPAEAAALALRAGVDMDMASSSYSEHLGKAVAADASLMPLVDEAVGRILTAKARLGLFDDPYGFGDAAAPEGPTPETRKVALEAALKSIVLLRNEGDLLPLKLGQKVVLIGGIADDASSMLGSWRARGVPEEAISLREAFTKAKVIVDYQPGVTPRSDDVSGIPAAVAAAKKADAVLLALGEDYDFSGEARSYASIDLPGPQQALIDAIKATGKPIVAILVNGRPLALEKALEGIPAVLESWFLGLEAGRAVVHVVTGERAPGGRLPIGMPRHGGQAPMTYAHRNTGRPANTDLTVDSARYRDVDIGPLFPFGHGLTYSRFVYSRLGVAKLNVGPDEAVEVTLTVTNIGKVAGDEVVQVYSRDPVASVARPVKELRAFTRLSLKPGEGRRLKFTFTPDQFAIWKDGKWVIEPGRIELLAGSSSEDLHAFSGFTIREAGEGKRPAASIETKIEIS